jgi:hypothetical protein
MVLEDRGFNFVEAPWFSRLIEALVTMKLDSVLC